MLEVEVPEGPLALLMEGDPNGHHFTEVHRPRATAALVTASYQLLLGRFKVLTGLISVPE